MKSMMKRTTLREIKLSFGRFFAIFAIIALGVGFFAGLQNTTPTMLKTANEFFTNNCLYDYRLISTIGWTDSEVELFKQLPDVKYVEGSYSYDVIYSYDSKHEMILKTHSLTDNVNLTVLKKGRMPSSSSECVVDSRIRNIPKIGDTITVSESNLSDTKAALSFKELTVVGYIDSSYYINIERGTTSLGNGSVAGFAYVLPSAFTGEYYTEIFVKFSQDYPIYSQKYENYMSDKRDIWENMVKLAAKWRYLNVLLDTINSDDIPELKQLPEYKEIEELASSIDLSNIGELANSSEIVRIIGLIDKIDLDSLISTYRSSEFAQDFKLDTFILERNANTGYAGFEGNSKIIEQIARVFPIFFILVAALVCMTTMSRMVEEQRTQIGILKALGYSSAKIMSKYMFYSGSAAVCGCIFGYSVGIILFPKVIWTAYSLMYISIPLNYVFDYKLALISLIVAFICSIGTTWFSCHIELSETSAALMRPKAPKAGKRIFLERIPFVWKRLKFLYKVSIRNIFRYKKRFFMMILGISGCTALLLTGFGLYDSVADFAKMQYEDIELSDAGLVYLNGDGEKLPQSLENTLDEVADDYLIIHEASWDLVTNDSVKGIYLLAPNSYDNIDRYVNFHTEKGETLEPPSDNGALISNGIAKRLNIHVGDEVLLRDERMRQLKLTITGIYENHVYNYIFVDKDNIEEQLGEEINCNTLYINLHKNADMHKSSATLLKNKNVAKVSLFVDLEKQVSDMMKSLNYVVYLVIFCAAFLAFIVIYNLTNINITERIREIATIKVLGFFKKETSAYVFRENLLLTSIGIALGLVLGVLLHSFVISNIVVDIVSFKTLIKPVSFLYSIVLTFIFNLFVNFIMSKKLDRINMAESLKSVE